jgi:hypothetical protein
MAKKCKKKDCCNVQALIEHEKEQTRKDREILPLTTVVSFMSSKVAVLKKEFLKLVATIVGQIKWEMSALKKNLHSLHSKINKYAHSLLSKVTKPKSVKKKRSRK